MSTITTRQNAINVMTMAARTYGRRSSRTRLEGYAIISKLLDNAKFNNKESVKSTFKNIANVLKSNGFEIEKCYAPLFYFEAQARGTGFEPIEWVKEELTAELFPEPKTEQSKKAEAPKTEQLKSEQPKKAEAPKTEQPKKAEAPKTEQPKTEQSKTEQPKKAEDALSIIDYLDEDEIKKLSDTLNLTLTEGEIKSFMDKVNMLTINDMRAINMINMDDIVSSSIKDIAETATETDIAATVLTKIKEAVNRERVTAVLEDAVAVKLCAAYASKIAPIEEAPSVNKDLSVHDPDPSKSREEKVKFIEEKIKVSDDFMSSAFKIDESTETEKVNLLYSMLTSDELANTLKQKYGFAGTPADIELTAVPITRYPGQPEKYQYAFEIGSKGFKKKARKKKIVILYNPDPVKDSGSVTIDRRIGYAEQFKAATA